MSATKNATRRIPASDVLACGAGSVEVLAAKDDKSAATSAGSFNIVGYTGAPVSRWYGPLVIDLAGMSTPKKLPILMDHDAAKRVGFSTDDGIEKTEKALKLTGPLLKNEHGTTFAAESAQGFPFQASVGVEFLRVEELKAGDEKKVNGRLVRGPCDIATKSRLREVSVLACGADSNTSAEAFSRDAKNGQETIEVMSEPTNTPAPAPTPAPVKIDFAAIKAAVNGRADLALEALEKGFTPDQAKGLLADALTRENDELRKQIAAKSSTAPAAKPVEVVPFGGAREAAGDNLKPAGANGANADVLTTTLAPDEIEDLEPAAVVALASSAIEKDKALRKEFKGNAADLAAFARASAAGRVAIYEPANGRFDAISATKI